MHAYFTKIWKRFTTRKKKHIFYDWFFLIYILNKRDLCDLAYTKTWAIFRRKSEALRMKSWGIIFKKRKETSASRDSIVRLNNVAPTSLSSVLGHIYPLWSGRREGVCISGKRGELRHRPGSCHFSTERIAGRGRNKTAQKITHFSQCGNCRP